MPPDLDKDLTNPFKKFFVLVFSVMKLSLNYGVKGFQDLVAAPLAKKLQHYIEVESEISTIDAHETPGLKFAAPFTVILGFISSRPDHFQSLKTSLATLFASYQAQTVLDQRPSLRRAVQAYPVFYAEVLLIRNSLPAEFVNNAGYLFNNNNGGTDGDQMDVDTPAVKDKESTVNPPFEDTMGVNTQASPDKMEID